MTINIDYQIFTPLIPFVLGIVLKILLDLNLAIIVIKYLWWIPVRPIFRIKVYDISGEWQQVWENTTSERYVSEDGRRSKVKMKQFGRYCYGEFRSKNDEEYYILGEIYGKTSLGLGQIGKAT